MAEKENVKHTEVGNPTNLDLHVEQARQGVLLDRLSNNVHDIKDVLVGSENRVGLVIEVDRLKQSRRNINATLWVVFTAVIGTTVTFITAFIN